MNWLIPLLLLLFAIFLPRYGLVFQFRNRRAARQREQVEDALKHLLNRKLENRAASPESLAGTLGLPRAATLKLLTRMDSLGLLERRGSELELTPEGERWAMHIVRAHRLWERYLADEARMPLKNIHREAQRREHTLTPAQADEMDAALGHPVRDPHGDPIPDREGHFTGVQGMPLTAWPAEDPARIVHLEDEPPIAYQTLLAEGLRLGQTLRILEKSPQRYLLSDGENEYRIAPAVAANIFVAPLPEAAQPPRDAIPLHELTYNQRAEIVALDEAVQGFTRRRLLDLGLTPGTLIFPELRNFFGEPRAYRVRGTLIALRNDQATQIWVRPIQG